MKKRISGIIFLGLIFPLSFYGIFTTLRTSSIILSKNLERMKKVSERIAEEISLYFENNFQLLQTFLEYAGGANINDEQMDILLSNSAAHFPHFLNICAKIKEWKCAIDEGLDLNNKKYNELEPHRWTSNVMYEKDTEIPYVVIGVSHHDPVFGEMLAQAKLSLIYVWKKLLQPSEETGFELMLVENGKRILVYTRKTKNAQALVFSGKDISPFLKSIEKGNLTINPLNEWVSAISIPVKTPGWTLLAEQKLSYSFSEITSSGLKFISFLLSVILLSILISYYRSGFIVGAVDELKKATEETSRENFDYELRLSTGDELEILGESFNMMNLRIKELIKKVQEKEKQITFMRLVRGIYHDLKHSLEGIKGAVNAHITDAYKLKTSIEKYLEEADQLFSDLRTLSREQINLILVKTNVKEVVDLSLKKFEEKAKSKKLELRRNVEDKIYALAHPDLLRRVIDNLIDNSITATKTGWIEVGAREEDENVILYVEDTGEGIAPEIIDKIFEWEFTTKPHGLGLGLAVVRKIVDDFGGKIEVESEIKRGTKITIKLKRFK